MNDVIDFTNTALDLATAGPSLMSGFNGGAAAGGGTGAAMFPAAPEDPSSLPLVPQQVTAVSLGPTVAAVGWLAADLATTYQLRYDDDPAMGSPTTITGITALGKSLTGLTEGTTYYVQVRGTNTDGSSDWSRTVHFRAGDIASSLARYARISR